MTPTPTTPTTSPTPTTPSTPMPLQSLTAHPWDIVIAGAGPAGALLAHQLATRTALYRRILLVDRAHFPRNKVCGCCLSAAGVDLLRAAGLAHILTESHALPLDRMLLSARGTTASIPLRAGVALSRHLLDAALAGAARDAGATFLDATAARLLPARAPSHHSIRLTRGHESATITASLCIAADGLAGSFLGSFPSASQPHLQPRIHPRSRIGLSAIVPMFPDAPPPGAITMLVGEHAYIGLVRLEDGSIDLAACADPSKIKSAGGPTLLLAPLLHAANIHPDPAALRWHATPRLTRSRAPAAHRLFILGDAAAYIEPFTGEGMTWALAAALAAAPRILQALNNDPAPALAAWSRDHHNLLAGRTLACSMLARLTRHPFALSLALRAARALPPIAASVAAIFSRTPKLPSISPQPPQPPQPPRPPTIPLRELRT